MAASAQLVPHSATVFRPFSVERGREAVHPVQRYPGEFSPGSVSVAWLERLLKLKRPFMRRD